MEQSDVKASKLKEELVNTKEALNRALLEREVIGHEKSELGLCFCVTEFLFHCGLRILIMKS